MIILIPLGGLGLRFKNNGYFEPKALINIENKPLIFWLIDNLNINKSIDFVYIPYNKEYKKYNIEKILLNKYPNINFRFLCLENNTNGAAETISIALNDLISKNYIDMPIL